MSIEKYLLLSKGEQKGSEKARNYILANSVEAIIGALYLDGGYEVADKFISQYIISKLPEVLKKKAYIDAKSKFQEMSQEKYRTTPIYRVIKEEGLDHEKQFEIGVYLGKRIIGRGKGSSKQEAQQKAAREALDKLESEK